MHLGYIRFGSVEVANTERLQAYVDNGLVPDGTTVEACDGCEGLSAAIEGLAHEPYRSPQLDEPAWFDADDPDSWDFAGVLPLTITGADTTTGTVDVTSGLDEEVVIGKRRRGPRTIGVTAMLIGRTTEAVEVGLSWLTRALQSNCDDAPCPGIGDVELFTSCPGPVGEEYDPTAAPVLVTGFKDDDDWVACNGTATVTPAWIEFEPFEADPVDGGDPDGPWDEPELDGGDPDGPWGETINGGSPGFIPGELIGTIGALTSRTSSYAGGPLVIEAFVGLLTGASADASIQFAIINPTTCEVLHYGPVIELQSETAGSPEEYEWSIPGGVINCDEPWAPALLTDVPIGVQQIRGRWQPILSGEACIAPYRRTFPRAVLVAGPTVVESIPQGDCGIFHKVEWTWVASPYRFGTERLLVEELRNASGTFYDYKDPDVTAGHFGGGTTSDPVLCPAPLPLALDCASDPGYPSWVAPPAAPTVPDPNRITVGMEPVSRVWLIVPPAVTPSGEAALTIALHARVVTEPKVGVRVRIYATDELTPTTVDTCDFDYEYHIDYIPGGGVLTIDGRTGQITTLCAGTTEPIDASNVVRGNYDGPVLAPVLRCDQRYMVVIDHLATYPRTVPGSYTEDDPEGLMGATVTMWPREG